MAAPQAARLQEGSAIPWKNQTGGTLTVGNVQVVGNRLGVLIQGANPIDTTLANAASGEVAIDGVWQLPKVTTDTWVEGQEVFWDTVAQKLTMSQVAVPAANVAPGLIYAGRAAKIGLNGDTKGYVKLNDGADNSPIEFNVSWPDQATADITITNPYNVPIRIIDVLLENNAANGANANTIQVCAAAAGASPISDAMSLNAVAAGGLVRAASNTVANAAIAALTNFFIRQTKAGGTMGGIARIRCARGK
jgi:predicted RecA/RadA family phage recombinase